MTIPLRVAALFLRELAERGIPVTVPEEGRYSLQINGLDCEVKLESLIGEFALDGDAERVTRFVDAIVAAAVPIPTKWEDAKAGLRFMAESSTFDFGDAIYETISESLCRVLVYSDADENRITWLTAGDIIGWGQPKEHVEAAASLNMAKLLERAEIHIEPIEEYRLGLFKSDSLFKGSFLFSPNLREIVEPKLGWPIFAVIPCRDFCYLIPEEDEEMLRQLGTVVVREFENQENPVSTEVFLVGDEGIEAIGEFRDTSDGEGEDDDSDDGMQTIDYGEGLVQFRIPAHWIQRNDEEGAAFLDPEEPDFGTLQLQVITLEAPGPVGGDTAAELLIPRAAEHGVEIELLENGNAFFTYVEEAEEEGEKLLIQYWVIASGIPPAHARIALFSFTLLEEFAEDEEIEELLDLLDDELRESVFP